MRSVLASVWVGVTIAAILPYAFYAPLVTTISYAKAAPQTQ